MAQTTAGASHGLTHRNNGATVVYGGNVDSSSTVTNVPGRTQIAGHRSGRHGAIVVESSNIGTHQPLSTGTFFYRGVRGRFVGMRYPGWISGVATTVLERGANHPHRNVLGWSEAHRRLHITAYDIFTGSATIGGNAGDSVTYHNIRGSGNVDDAAHPTRAVPGEFVYTATSKPRLGSLASATQADYPAKNNG